MNNKSTIQVDHERAAAPVTTKEFYARLSSRYGPDYQGNQLSAMRHGLGGHAENPPVD
jgi:6-phosphogluconate dehydrogenase (decarboxylating)